MKEGERKFDDVLVELGEFGKYQIWIYNLLCMFEFFVPWHMLVTVFLSGEPDHWCKIPEWDSVDCASYGYNTSLECAMAKREVGIPWSNSTEDGEMGRAYASCERYNVTGQTYSPQLDLQGYATVGCDAGWVYDNTEIGGVTVNEEFDAVCGGEYQVSVAQSLFFAGTAVGSVFCGFMSDKFGRRRSLFSCLIMSVVAGVITAFSTNIWMFMVFKFIDGIATIGMVQISFVLANEIIGPAKRYIAGNVIWIHFAVGYMCLALVAFFIRNWRYLQLVSSIIPGSLLIFFIMIPESPRWLLSKGRIRESTKIMRKLAKINGVHLKETFTMDNVKKDTDADKKGILEAFRRPHLRGYMLNLMLQLAVNTIVYYAISLSTSSLGVNKYVAFALAGAVEIPACFVVIHPIEYFGRRSVYIFFMALCGASIFATIFIAPGIARAAVAMVGKLAITSSFCIVYLHACEIFPTPVRNSALGICTLWSNMSNILGPLILLLAGVWDPLPLVIFTVMSFVGGAVAYFLPETRGKKIPETMDEGENIGWKAAPRIKRKAPPGFHSNIDYHKAGEEVGEPV